MSVSFVSVSTSKSECNRHRRRTAPNVVCNLATTVSPVSLFRSPRAPFKMCSSAAIPLSLSLFACDPTGRAPFPLTFVSCIVPALRRASIGQCDAPDALSTGRRRGEGAPSFAVACS